MIDKKLYSKELSGELKNILQYWMEYATDAVHGGFYGAIDDDNVVNATAEKGAVLNARILWSFSAAYRYTKNPGYLSHAYSAYDYFKEHFTDKKNGGIYWSVNFSGAPADKKKQVYAQSFAVYALSEFYRATGVEEARQLAINLFDVIERYSYDNANTGYIDAFTVDWQPMEDIRLSAKDANEQKTMNTHLHILEGYTNLYRIWPEDRLKKKIRNLLRNFIDHIIDQKTNHLVLFFDEHWNRKSTTVSYGHDIEAAWLLLEAAKVIEDALYIETTKAVTIKIADAAVEGLDADGGLWYEYEPGDDHLVKEKHWWPQAEAMVGFFNAWEVSGNEKYLHASFNSWNFIKAHLLDKNRGEWFWGIDANDSIMQGYGKVGLWKCPYHNSRACLEIIKRIQKAGM